jgi:hypothetical protein
VTARERVVVITGAVVVVAAVLLARVLLPGARAWQARDAQLDAARTRAGALQGLVSATASLETGAAARERALSTQPRRLVQARSVGLAANAVQALLQEAADGAGLLVNRVDVDAEPDSTGAITATLNAYGDVHGLAELLRLLGSGPRAAVVQRLTVQQNSALRGAPDVIQVSIGVRAPVLITGADDGGAP